MNTSQTSSQGQHVAVGLYIPSELIRVNCYITTRLALSYLLSCSPLSCFCCRCSFPLISSLASFSPFQIFLCLHSPSCFPSSFFLLPSLVFFHLPITSHLLTYRSNETKIAVASTGPALPYRWLHRSVTNGQEIYSFVRYYLKPGHARLGQLTNDWALYQQTNVSTIAATPSASSNRCAAERFLNVLLTYGEKVLSFSADVSIIWILSSTMFRGSLLQIALRSSRSYPNSSPKQHGAKIARVACSTRRMQISHR